jgi:hypothetical protein
MVQRVSQKISELDVVTSLAPTDYFPVVAGGVTSRITRASLASLALSYIDPRILGAVGDGVTDDKAAMLLAIAAGVATSKPVAGLGLTYGIAGNMTLVESAWLRDITFKQLTPAAGSVRTLTSAGGSNIRLERVTVDRNGSGTDGAHQDDAGVYISGGTGHYFENVEVFGDGKGGGFVLYNATDCDLVGVHVHDMSFVEPGATNDRINGIWVVDCVGVRLDRCLSHDLLGDYGSGLTARFTRGFTFSGSREFQVHGCRTWNVDQGNDVTGASGNSWFHFSDCFAVDCKTVGFKCSNTARDGQFSDCTSVRAGVWGFVVNGPTGAGVTALATSNIQFSDCAAYDTGYPHSLPVAGTKVGFRAMQGSYDLDTTLGIRFIGCKAHDRQVSKTMAYGFDNEIAASTTGNYNEAVNCVSIGHILLAFHDMHQSRCEVSRLLVQPITTGTWTPVEWTAEVDLGAMHSTVSNIENVFARREGNYRATFGATFPSNVTGQRGVRIMKNGGLVPGTTVLVDASTTGETSLQTSWSSGMSPGDSLRLEVYQDSGISLDLQTNSGGVVEQDV